MGANNTRIIAVANEKGGVGKTVMVINLGAALSLEGKKVLIVDMDPQFNATKGLGVDVNEETLTTYDLIKERSDNAADAILKTKWKGLDLIPSHVDLAGAEVELVDVVGRENRLKEALEGIAGEYDFILIDTPPSLSLLTVNVLTFANEVLVPCQTQPYSYSALDELFDTIFAIKEEINPDLKITGVVPTFFDRRTRISQSIMDRLKNDDRCSSLLFDTVIRINTTIADSADVGKPVVFYRKSSYGSSDHIELAKELLARN
ncbi:MAG: AAA family ATPase [Proteobacteria bacterium]|nr:ParA family protein [Desulfobacteraceae bacterium]MBU4014222.1 AAA family ATPase [Pseudomonadota bacterium]MBU4066884.1 AAA family ATPase [Pseudomonadota bacterium]MBU4099819.1 AAA family ATPase [Pseudomonadota bacterium]MBU4126363.1 AAA family ATPase [Pseudomonadota bacterium]